MAQGAKCEGDWAVAQFDITGLSHNPFGIRNGEVREVAMILFETVGAFGVGLAQHLSMKIHELLAELHDLILGFEVLKGVANGRIGQANGNRAKGSGVELGVSLHDIKEALRREGVAMMADMQNDFTFFGVRVSGEYKGKTCCCRRSVMLLQEGLERADGDFVFLLASFILSQR